jgi:hypothetical protein
MRIALYVLTFLIGALVSAVIVAARRWDAATAAVVRDLYCSRTNALSQPLSAELADLPAPVQRYLRAILGPSPASVRVARIEHEGEFLLKPPNDWRAFRSQQFVAVQAPGFVWDARISMLPMLSVRVRDALVNGRGSILGKVAGLITVVDVKDTSDTASGALHRYLAEATWVPTALLPSAGVHWSAIDDSTARATLGTGATTVWLDFHFGADGMVQRVYTPARARDVGGRAIPTPWEGRFTRYESRDGFLIPIEAEVAWLLPSGRQTYWRGRIITVENQRQSRPE